MRHGIVLFTSDRGITPAAAARAAEERGFATFYVPEHTHIPVRRTAAHPGTGDETLPDDRYLRTLDPWVALATAAAVTTRIGLSTAVALPVESDPITLAKTIASLDHLSGGRVALGAGFGWNTDELADHHVPAERRRTVLREYVEAMRALWTQEEAAYAGEFVSFGPSWAYPKPAQAHIPLIIGAGGGPKTFAWIARHADGWMTTPTQQDITGSIERLHAAWREHGREGVPDVRVLITFRPDPADLQRWAELGVTELIWGVPDAAPDAAEAHLDKLAARLGVAPAALVG
ncbi:TIGR03619 family F420-dependent LLM class oxidoreductase [Nocardioides sp. TRM66260-LWL]|uniref:TIGR03619 family F420-dependent LLM class oxidoreductase n=1 Tax=Nocardioides sp. TRM66260-LWL TaxID=2874478 RepID=UPI001CC39654|nr:TIGR03619 family F420-dependent LLM class oxidoreductase [Nocardioides sp. TRM66260-LWL]MBZ5735085.1 TIGR03619 family F420-dependent LLM class oxidoreductase [Nocardioides sp. TRM66260-LWL]